MAKALAACCAMRQHSRPKSQYWHWRDYSPQARGMQAALPYVDLFAPAHNLESPAALEPYLARI
jgi:uncharacterized protein with von Willebrand factor type A (vWA) domain